VPESLANGLAFVPLVSSFALTHWNAHQDSWIPLRNSQTRKAAMSRPRLHIRNGTGEKSSFTDSAGKDTQAVSDVGQIFFVWRGVSVARQRGGDRRGSGNDPACQVGAAFLMSGPVCVPGISQRAPVGQRPFRNGFVTTAAASGHDPKTLEQLLTQLHRDPRVVAAQHLLAHFRVHRGELPQKIVATLRLRITAPSDSDRQQRGRRPDSNVPLLNHLPS
jgi:hypothetical protein